jgi:HAMP domain-containing protein
MRANNNTEPGNFMFALLPIFPSLFFGFVLIWQQGIGATNVSLVALTVIFSVVSSYFVWVWHTDHLEKQSGNLLRKHSEGLKMLMSYTVELERLVMAVEPMLVEQITTAKELTEQEISVLVQRFSVMRDEINQITESATQTDDEKLGADNLENMRVNAVKIRNEIDFVLEALQFQDRVSQILALVQENLSNLRGAVETIQQQGSERHQKMLKVEETIANIQTRFDTVNYINSRTGDKQAADDLTFF